MRPAMSHADVDQLETALARELPGFRVGYKDESRLQRVIAVLVWPFNRTYATAYTTVMGGVVWMPSRGWRAGRSPESLYALLRHEAVHLRDMRRFPILFPLTYALVLPTVFTLRSYWEARAYTESLRVEAELTGRIDDKTIEALVARFAGPDYLFMAPFRRATRRYFEARREEILNPPNNSE
jgi:hypothetical protein